MLRRPVIRGLVEDVRRLRQGEKPVGEARRHPQLSAVLGGELDTEPSSEGRRRGPDVDGDVPDRTGDDADELALRLWRDLVVETSQHAPLRVRVVVLDEIDIPTDCRRKRPPVVGLEEGAAVIAVDGRLDEDETGKVLDWGVHPEFPWASPTSATETVPVDASGRRRLLPPS